jgi:nucleoside-diphosphate-sugar epimerase
MKILITGNMGYVGPVVVRHLREAFPAAYLAGVDTGYFAACLTGQGVLPESLLDVQYFSDVRALPDECLSGVDAIVHLSAISNDPMGKAFEAVTMEINHAASIEIARKAKRAGVTSFVFASSCSVYGFAAEGARDETALVNPLTAYARSKVSTEDDLRELADDDFKVTCLRFATACGMSPRLRLDLVLNDFAAGALASGKITILSDGTPWRPLINVKDMARAIEWAIVRSSDEGGTFLVINTGSDEWNYQVKDLAVAVERLIPNVSISINENAQPDKRSYKVDFSLFRRLAPRHQPVHDLETTIQELRAGLEAIGFADAEFRESRLIRLKALENLRRSGHLTEDLYWNSLVEGTRVAVE